MMYRDASPFIFLMYKEYNARFKNETEGKSKVNH